MKTIDQGAWTEAVRKLKEATEKHVAAAHQEQIARSALTNATNELNAAQRELDKLIRAAKTSAPWNTDWHSEDARRTACAAP